MKDNKINRCISLGFSDSSMYCVFDNIVDLGYGWNHWCLLTSPSKSLLL